MPNNWIANVRTMYTMTVLPRTDTKQTKDKLFYNYTDHVNNFDRNVKNNNSILNVICMIPYVITATEFQDYPLSLRKQRQMEFVICLQKTLLHNQTLTVSVLYDDAELIKYMHNHTLPNQHKLQFIYQKSLTAEDMFVFIAEKFLGKLVLVMNADTYPGDGFELVR